MEKNCVQKVPSRWHLKLLFKLNTVVMAVILSLSFTVASAQQMTVKGTVTDASDGSGMPGVNVLIKGTANGVLTDVGGNYSIEVPGKDASLIFSFIGYTTIEQPVAGQSTVNVSMTESTLALDEVIVIGYGTQKKSDLTGSVSRVTLDEKQTLANTNLSQAMSGATAGVNVQANGLAGSDPDLSIRGKTSLSASDRPLIVLDGIIFNGSINDININDVESIDILKDASAAAVYGSRSANGVMLITTKKGRSEKPVIGFNMYYGYQDMTNNPMRVMNATEYATRLIDYYYQQDLYAWYRTKPVSDATRPAYPDISTPEKLGARLRTQEERDNLIAGNEIDWVKEVTEIAPIQNYNLSMSGRSDRSSYFMSASYTDEQGILINDQFSRITLHTNLESKITDWLTMGFITSYSYRDYSGVNASLGEAREASPLANNKIGRPDFDLYLTGENYMVYPLQYTYLQNEDLRNNLFMVGNAKITIPWIKGLTYEFNYSNTFNNRRNNTYHPSTTDEGRTNHGRAVKNPEEGRDWIFNNIVTYNGTFGLHAVNATLLYSRERRNYEETETTVQGFDNEVLGWNDLSLGTLLAAASDAWEENSISYMARANYTFNNRYMITGTFRRDGFSGFGPTNKFANFPSLSIAWVTSQESFMSSLPWLYLKTRLSYGENGNQGIGRYSSFSRMGTNSYVYGASTAIGVYPNVLGNASLGWETTASLNLGIDFGLFDNRVSGAVDLYTANTTDVLVKRALPPSSGYAEIWTNIGAIANRGVEFEINSINLTGKLGWETNIVFSLNRDEITKLYGGAEDKDIGNSWFVGEPISAIYDYEMAGGMWTEAELFSGNILNNWYPGQFKYIDRDGNGSIEPTNDRAVIGYRTPNYRFSINNKLTYKNFTLSVFINSIQGGKNFFLENNAGVTNVAWRSDDVYRINASAVRPYWTPTNGVNNATGVYNSPAVSSGIYQSRSFVRLQDVSLSYRFSPALLRSLKFQSAQVYVASKNPYVWTGWEGWDPETGTSNSPLMRNITAGFNLTF